MRPVGQAAAAGPGIGQGRGTPRPRVDPRRFLVRVVDEEHSAVGRDLLGGTGDWVAALFQSCNQ